MIKTVRAGGTINENDIPSPVFLASDATNVRATIPEPVTQRVQPQPKQPVPTLGKWSFLNIMIFYCSLT